MMRVAIAVLAVVLVVPTTLGQVDPNVRGPLADIQATDISVSGDTGWIAMGAADPGSTLNGNPGEKVWFLYDDEGLLRRNGHADADGCGTLGDPEQTAEDLFNEPFPPPTPDITNTCQADVVGLAISDDGRRLAIASVDSDGSNSRVWFATRGQGAFYEHPVEGTITTMAMSPDGRFVGIGIDTAAIASDPGEVRRLEWVGVTSTTPGVVDENWDAELEAVPGAITLDGKGNIAVGAGDTHVRFRSPGDVAFINDNIDGTVNAVAFTHNTITLWSVAGYGDGGVALYNALSDREASFPVLDFKPDDAAIHSVAISADGSRFWSGDEEGTLRMYANRLEDFLAPTTALGVVDGLDGPVHDMAVSRDGRYLVAGAGGEVTLFRVLDESLEPMWTHMIGRDVDAVAIDATGSQVAAVAAGLAFAYDPLREITVTGADPVVGALPGRTIRQTLSVENTGNRDEVVTLQVEAPAGWTATAEPSLLDIATGDSTEVKVNISIPAGHPAGDKNVRIRAVLSDGARVDTHIPVSVARVSLWDLAAVSAPNQGIDAGGVAFFDLTATNVGNGEDFANVTATIEQEGWSLVVDPVMLSAPPGGVIPINITLRAPADAGNLETARVDVYLDDDPTRALPLSATVGASFAMTAQATLPDGGAGGVDDPVRVRIEIRNRGNAPDAYEITVEAVPVGWNVRGPSGAPTHRIFGLEPGITAEAEFLINPAVGTPDGNYQIRFSAMSLGDPTKVVPMQVIIGVQEVVAVIDEPKEKSPGIGAVALLGAIAAVGTAMRRQRDDAEP